MAGTHRIRLRGLKLGDPDRELPRVLPLPVDPPRAVQGQPSEERLQLRPGRHLGRRHHGPARWHDDDVARRDQPRRAASRPRCVRGLRTVIYVNIFPNILIQPASGRLRDGAPVAAAGHRSHDDRVHAGCSRPRRPPGRDSSPSYAIDFWTSPTGRTGPRASPCSGACPRPTPFSGPAVTLRRRRLSVA